MNRRLRLLFIAMTLLFSHLVFSQTSLPLNTIVTENFNSIGSSATATLPANWRMSPSGNAVGLWSAGVGTTTQAASSGTPATGGRYNWATTAGTDRSVGFLTDGSYNTANAVMAYYRNVTGASVSSVTIAFAVERYVVNTPGIFSLSFTSSADGITWTPQTGGDIATGLFATGANAGTFGSPQTIYRTVTVNVTVPNNGDIYFRWVFNTSNTFSQGLGLDDVSVFAGTATPVLTAKLRDILQVDIGSLNQFNEGDVIRYQTVIKNTGTDNANNVQINIPPPSNTTLVGGSIKTSAVAVDDNYAASFNTLLNGTTVLSNDFGVPMPTVVQTFGPVSNAAATNAGSAGTTSAGGSLTVNANGTFSYTPPTGFTGTDQFKYITGNGNLPDNDAVVTITVGTDITFNTTNVDPLCNGSSSGSITFNASGGNGTLTYSITGAGGTYFASNIFTGLAAGVYNLAVKDAGGYIKTGSATLTNPPVTIIVSGTIPNLVYNTAMATATFTKTGGTGAIIWSATGLPTGVGINSSTGDVTGAPLQTGNFNAIITATDINGCTGTKNVSFNVAPKLANDIYTVVGNTQFVADGHSSPATPFATSAVNILSNDGSSAGFTVTAVTNAATTSGGTITIDAAGKFIYTPVNGSLVADSYTYTATSNGLSATATINFTIASMVWYVNNTYAGANGAANGSSHRPYTTVNAAVTPSLVNHYIYVHTGSGNTTGNALLKSGQTLRGAGSALTVGALSLAAGTKPMLTGMVTLANNVTVDGFDMTTGTTTAITNAGNTVTGVNVNLGNISTTSASALSLTGTGNNVTMTIASITTTSATNGINLTNTAGTVIINGGNMAGVAAGAPFTIVGGTVSVTYSGGLTQAFYTQMITITGGHNTGTITFQTGLLNATNGYGLLFDNADGTYNFNGTTTLHGGDASIGLNNGCSGTFNFNANTSVIDPTGTGIDIRASSPNYTFLGSISKTDISSPGNAIYIVNNTGGTINIIGTGTKAASTASSNAIEMTNNTGTTINISGNNLTLTTTTGIAFNATGGGTINVTGTGNTITSTTGTALNIVNTTIGSSNLNFKSISSTSASANPGIVLNNTGSSGSLHVDGDGGASNNGSGGTISNKTGVGISLTSTRDVSLKYMNIQNGGNDGVSGTTVTGFTMHRCNVTSNGNAAGENGVDFGGTGATPSGLFGTATITNSVFSNNYERQFIARNFNGAALSLSVTSCTFSSNSSLTLSDDGLWVEPTGTGNMTVNVQSSTFTANRGDHFLASAANSAVLNVIFQNNTLTGGHTTALGQGINIIATTVSPGYTGTVIYDINGNTINGAIGDAINVNLGTSSVAAAFTGQVRNNIIGTTGVLLSGSAQGAGINVESHGDGTHTCSVIGNTIKNCFDRGIDVLINDGNGNVNLTVQSNSIKEMSTNIAGGREAFFVNNGSSATNAFHGTPDSHFLCLQLGGAGALANDLNKGPNVADDFRVLQRFSTTIRLPGYGGASTDVAAVVAFITGLNNSTVDAVTTGSATTQAPGGGFVGGAACTQ